MADLDGPSGEPVAEARTGHAKAVQLEQRPVPAAQDVLPGASEVAVLPAGERPAGVGAAIDVAGDEIARADHEAGEESALVAEAEPLGARVLEVGQGAEPDARGGLGGIGLRAGQWSP